jgi:hypothetical protein
VGPSARLVACRVAFCAGHGSLVASLELACGSEALEEGLQLLGFVGLWIEAEAGEGVEGTCPLLGYEPSVVRPLLLGGGRDDSGLMLEELCYGRAILFFDRWCSSRGRGSLFRTRRLSRWGSLLRNLLSRDRCGVPRCGWLGLVFMVLARRGAWCFPRLAGRGPSRGGCRHSEPTGSSLGHPHERGLLPCLSWVLASWGGLMLRWPGGRRVGWPGGRRGS